MNEQRVGARVSDSASVERRRGGDGVHEIPTGGAQAGSCDR